MLTEGLFVTPKPGTSLEQHFKSASTSTHWFPDTAKEYTPYACGLATVNASPTTPSSFPTNTRHQPSRFLKTLTQKHVIVEFNSQSFRFVVVTQSHIDICALWCGFSYFKGL
jgi:hypothetical protein